MHWVRLPDLTTAIYDVRGAASADGSIFMYGGHLCTESKGSLPYYYTNTVSKLDLARAGGSIKLPKSACRVGGGDLPLQRGQGEAAMRDKNEL